MSDKTRPQPRDLDSALTTARVVPTKDLVGNKMETQEIKEAEDLKNKAAWNIGVKKDDGKQRYDLISGWALAGLVSVLTFGAIKYDDRNWELGIEYGRVFAACMRHMWAWWLGEDNDPETGLSHLHHAACCIHFLQHYVSLGEKYSKFDNRPNGRKV